ncbi:MAG: peptidyl-prolyl cis-trans isomerase B (cyclophilin B) [Parcubacteria group bacterium Gr01-1014_18]|nr:MAG: peptidyl-prolyl cis-trans isomerase B (cyclophilin B) [Parcubacteria group bacterium Greene0416_36]TSC81527.1 MAG: peptidyl-prolyl cis-trans isomerase B (cyclophilin B) [Parcubacteria group bacterium Gr01-1014_18]TSC99662.1 MAG: peptidyl-prolyl cis-trans isomerase B (cyclophilin B) [Parcubacteria group bacterium Greene1014_20]TSD07113.1 MAG: peptidyl-prolyl cis-trans isomerase B (cyclophilin B) [Parcubacteria group bacterium Greene0714_2]
MKKIAILLFSLPFLIGAGCMNKPTDIGSEVTPVEQKRTLASVETNMGTLKIRFFDSDAPKTVENFVKLSKEGFYDGIKFHRIIKGFMLQTGDPNSRLADWSLHGRGGPGYAFADEINAHKMVRGMVAMANYGPNTNGSQFFVVSAPSTPWLDGKHTVFGEVVSGMEVIDRIEGVKVNANDHPLAENEVVITKITIE